MALTDSLVASWELDEASGNAIDSHGSNDLTETSGTIAASTGPGGVGGSRDFEAGDTEYFTITDNSDVSTGDIDFTFEAWVNLESTSGNLGVLGQRVSSSNSYGYILFYNSGSARFDWRVGNSTGTAIAGTVLANNFGAASTGTWYQIICWHDAASNQIGICVNNGTPNTASTSGATADVATNFNIGCTDTGGANLFDGLISKVRMWKRVLTSDERTELYNGGSGLAYPFSASSAPVVTPFRNRLMSPGHIFGGKCLC